MADREEVLEDSLDFEGLEMFEELRGWIDEVSDEDFEDFEDFEDLEILEDFLEALFLEGLRKKMVIIWWASCSLLCFFPCS